MMAPFDTALLKHQPEHVRQPTEFERAAAGLALAHRRRIREFFKQVYDLVPRHGSPTTSQPLTETQY